MRKKVEVTGKITSIPWKAPSAPVQPTAQPKVEPVITPTIPKPKPETKPPEQKNPQPQPEAPKEVTQPQPKPEPAEVPQSQPQTQRDRRCKINLYQDFNVPLDTFEKSKLFQEKQIQEKVQQRLKHQEDLLDNMEKGTKISGKDKFITNKGNEVNYFSKKNVDFHMKRTKDKYDIVTKLNEGYEDKKIGRDNYFKSYVDNAKPESLEKIEADEIALEDKKYEDQGKYYNALNSQVERRNMIRNKFEENYQKNVLEDKKRYDEKYMKQQGEKEAKRQQRKKDFCTGNNMIINVRNENDKNRRDQELAFDNEVNANNAKELNFIEDNNYQKEVNNKAYYRKALDKQIEYQKQKAKRQKDIEAGNF